MVRKGGRRARKKKWIVINISNFGNDSNGEDDVLTKRIIIINK